MRTLSAILFLLLGGCASYDGRGLAPGRATSAEVEALMGAPTLVRAAPDGGKVLWYSRQPFGRDNFAVRLDSRGTLVSIEQRLTKANIDRIRRDRSTPEEVLDLLGPPWKVGRLERQGRETWEYWFRNSVDPYMLFVQFSDDRVVREVIEIYEASDVEPS